MPQKRTIPRECLNCGNTFMIRANDVEIGIGKYCSNSCSANHLRGNKIEYVCRLCHERFLRCPSTVNDANNVFCSKKCSYICKRGGRDVQWENGKRIQKGYYTVWRDGKYQNEHRIAMENHLNRKLSSKEHVHHINQNTLDNRIENLMVLSASAHSSLHHKGKKLNKWSKKYTECQHCKTTKTKHHARGLCANCWQKYFHHRR